MPSQVGKSGVAAKDGTSYSSPLLADFGDVHQIVQWNHEAIVGVEIETGKETVAAPYAAPYPQSKYADSFCLRRACHCRRRK